MKAISPSMLGYQIRSIILGSTTTYSQLSGKFYTSGKLSASDAISAASTASVDPNQPAYSASYNLDRGLASGLSGGGGCGLVRKFDEFGRSGHIPPGTETWYVLGVLSLFLLPLIVMTLLRVERSPISRRKHERFKVNSEVRICLGERELVGSISSLSMGGVQVNTDALLDDGGLVTLKIASPQGHEAIEVAGRVVWSESNKSYGVAFADAPDSALSRIADWTRSLQKAKN